MADNSTILLSSNPTGDQIKIDLSVLEVILGIAASQVDGVRAMRGSFKSNLTGLLGYHDRGRGVSLHVSEDNELTADVYAYFDYGINVPQIAVELQKTLMAQLKQMTDLKLAQINIHVVGLISQKESTQNPASDQQLFSENDKNEDNH